MISDNERREVARRLREYASWDEDGELVGCTEFGEAVLNLLSCGDTERECFNALADLIEPSEPKVRCVAEVKVDGERLEQLVHDAAVKLTGIDRDALLRLAEDVAESAAMAVAMDDSKGTKLLADMLLDIARRIREACGEVGE